MVLFVVLFQLLFLVVFLFLTLVFLLFEFPFLGVDIAFVLLDIERQAVWGIVCLPGGMIWADTENLGLFVLIRTELGCDTVGLRA